MGVGFVEQPSPVEVAEHATSDYVLERASSADARENTPSSTTRWKWKCALRAEPNR